MPIPKLKETSCTCKECVNMCKKRPCWGTPEEIKKIIDHGYAWALMRDYWVGRFREDQEGDVYIISPAIVNYQGKSAPNWPRGRCIFLNRDDRCEIYFMRPIEARVAHHNQTVGIHKEVAETWDTPEGQKLVKTWEQYIR